MSVSLPLLLVAACLAGGESASIEPQPGRGTGRTKVEDDGALRVKYAPFSIWVDGPDVVAREDADLVWGSISRDGDGPLTLCAAFAGLIPRDADVELVVEFLLDTDDSRATGWRRGDFSGIDRVVRIELRGRFGSARASIVGDSAILPAPTVSTSQIISCGMGHCEVTEIADAVQLELPLDALGTLGAESVPYRVTSAAIVDGRVVAADEGPIDWLPLPPEVEPTLTTSPLEGFPGERVSLSGTHYPPRSAVQLTIGGARAPSFEITTDAAGSFASSFVVPDEPAGKYSIESGLDASILRIRPRLRAEPSSSGAEKLEFTLRRCRPGVRFRCRIMHERPTDSLVPRGIDAFASVYEPPVAWGVSLDAGVQQIGDDGSARIMVEHRGPPAPETCWLVAVLEDRDGPILSDAVEVRFDR